MEPQLPAQAPPPPTRVYLSLSKAVLPEDASIQISSTFANEEGGRVVVSASWVTSDSTVASFTPSQGSTLSATSVVLNTHKAGTAILTVSGGGLSTAAVVTVRPALQFASVAAGGAGDLVLHACALTVSGVAYCWGVNYYGALGLDTATDDCGDGCNAVPRPVAGGLAFKALTASSFTCGATEPGEVYCWGFGYGPTPAKVPTDVAVRTLSAGAYHVCGLASDGSAYCWGSNAFGQLGDGTRQSSDLPIPVAGGLRFTAISAGGNHTCGLVTEGVAYCWGSNYVGLALGLQDTASSAVPTRVSGDMAFVSVSAGLEHTCGLTQSGQAYCWGANEYGQLGFISEGDPTCATPQSCSQMPGQVSGGITFGLIDASGEYTCGLTQSGQAYCWGGLLVPGTCAPGRGDNPGGGFGGFPFCIPQLKQVSAPEPLPGTTLFSTRGGRGSCWMGLDGAAYCWGGVHGSAPERVPGQQP